MSFKKLLYWSVVGLLCCVSFCCTAKHFTCTCRYILFHILFHHGLSQDFEYSSLCYTVGPCCLSISVWMPLLIPKLRLHPSPSLHPLKLLVVHTLPLPKSLTKPITILQKEILPQGNVSIAYTNRVEAPLCSFNSQGGRG